jgi:hypothetical protein
MSVGKPKVKWESGVWKDAKVLLQIWGKKTEENTARKRGEGSWKKKEYLFIISHR